MTYIAAKLQHMPMFQAACLTLLLPCCCVAVIPPGFELTGANIALCGDGAYRAEWVSIAASASVRKCVACGTGIAAEAIEPITLYSLNTTVEAGANTDYNVVNIKVTASSKSCCEWHRLHSGYL